MTRFFPICAVLVLFTALSAVCRADVTVPPLLVSVGERLALAGVDARRQTDFLEENLVIQSREPLRFIVCSDIHENPRQLSVAVEMMRAIDSSFILFVGDLTDRFQKRYVDRMMSIFDKLSLPFLPVMGNHERMCGTYRSYLERFGPPNYSFSAGPAYFVVIDSSRGFIEASVLEWLEKRLKQAALYRYRFIVTHVPVRDPRPEEHHCLASVSAAKLRSLAALYKVNVVFSGHIHQSYTVVLDGVRYVTAGVVGGRIYNLPQEGGYRHFLVVECENGRVRIEQRLLGRREGAFSVWCGDLKMRALYRKRLEASAPGEKAYDRYSKRMNVLVRKFERYRDLLVNDLENSASKSDWMEGAALDISRQPAAYRNELKNNLDEIIRRSSMGN